jgi:hypothetical protein
MWDLGIKPMTLTKTRPVLVCPRCQGRVFVSRLIPPRYETEYEKICVCCGWREDIKKEVPRR